MDIRINLLPPELLFRQNQWRRQRQFLYAGGIVLALFLIIFAVFLTSTQLINTDINRLIRERQAVEGEVQGYKQFSEMRDRLARIEGLLQKAMGTPSDLNKTLSDISLNIPLNVWLTELTLTGKDGAKTSGSGTSASTGGAINKTQANRTQTNNTQNPTKNSTGQSVGEVSIKGWTFDHYSVALWLEELEKVYGLKDLRCQLSSNEKLNQDQGSMIRFEIKATLEESTKERQGR
jgi:Tfp pilus assembly protein PilN